MQMIELFATQNAQTAREYLGQTADVVYPGQQILARVVAQDADDGMGAAPSEDATRRFEALAAKAQEFARFAPADFAAAVSEDGCTGTIAFVTDYVVLEFDWAEAKQTLLDLLTHANRVEHHVEQGVSVCIFRFDLAEQD